MQHQQVQQGGLGGPHRMRHFALDQQVYEALAGELEGGWRFVPGGAAACPPGPVRGFADPHSLTGCLDMSTQCEVAAQRFTQFGGQQQRAAHQSLPMKSCGPSGPTGRSPVVNW